MRVMGTTTARGYTCGCEVAKISSGGCLFGSRAGHERVTGPLKTHMCASLASAFEEQQEGAAMQVCVPH